MIDFIKANRHYVLALSILFVVVSLSETTYSLFLKSDSTNDFSYNTGLLDLQFIEDEQIVLNSAFPMNDSEAIKKEPYILTLKNTGSLPYLFDLKMIATESDNTIDSKYIKIKLNNNLPRTLSEVNNVITSNLVIYPNEEMTFKINIWLDSSTPNNELGKNFSAKVITSGYSIYRTIDASGANHPKLNSDMIPVYYDENSKSWHIAASSNTNSDYAWYNYDEKKWANSVTIKDSEKKIYDIKRLNDIKVDNLTINNSNLIIDEDYLNLGISNYNYDLISNIFRVKFNNINNNKIYLISNSNMSYYYDSVTKTFKFKINNREVSSENYNIEKDKWYILGYTYDSNKISFYVNGNKIGTYNISGNINSNSSFKIGTDSSLKEISKMTIGNILIYNRILKDREISENYKTSMNIIYDGLLSGYSEFNPMTLKEYYLSRNSGFEIKDSDISNFYVWIPRFKYKLWNVTGESNIDTYNAYKEGIDIVFEKETNSSGTILCDNIKCFSDREKNVEVTKSDNGKYYTHPAFKNANGELTGLWISKYELSTNGSASIQNKAGATAWRNNNLSNYYQTILKIDDTNDYHIIKNTEWGAVSYLSHSKYGLCESNSCKEIGNNKTYVSGSDSSDTTTGNIYGVFDMSGSAAEYTMGNFTNDDNLNLTNSLFKDMPISNDAYDLYQENSFILGDATKELLLENSLWYGNSFKAEDSPWIIRGGRGIYYYDRVEDIASDDITTRIVIK